MENKNKEIITAGNIMYKTLGLMWLCEALCPASAFVTADSDEARNPQRFIHVTVSIHAKKRLGDRLLVSRQICNN